MNIFMSSINPIHSAQALDDKRVIKMILETAQILSTSLRLNGYQGDDVYKSTHERHPCVLWTSSSIHNFVWLIAHGEALSQEYTYRFADRTHRSMWIIAAAAARVSRIPNSDGFTKMPFCGPSDIRTQGDEPYDQYRQLLMQKWESDKRTPRWSRRGHPDWYQKHRSDSTC